MGAFLWAGRGSWDVGREDYLKKKSCKGSRSNIKVLCSICRRMIAKNYLYKHNEKVHGIKYVSLKDLKAAKIAEDKEAERRERNERKRLRKAEKKAQEEMKQKTKAVSKAPGINRMCVTCSNYNRTGDVCSITNKNEQRKHCLFYKLGEAK